MTAPRSSVRAFLGQVLLACMVTAVTILARQGAGKVPFKCRRNSWAAEGSFQDSAAATNELAAQHGCEQ